MKKQIIISMMAMAMLILLICPVVFAKPADSEFAKDVGESAIQGANYKDFG